MEKFKKGQALIVGIIFMGLILIFSSTIFTKVSRFISFGSKSVDQQEAIHVAEAGIDKALRELKVSALYTGEVGTPVGQTGTFTTTISNVSETEKTITTTGYIPNAAAPRSKQTITVDVSAQPTYGSYNFPPYSVFANTNQGVGIWMEGSATIFSSAFSNASISGGNQNYIYAAYAVSSISPQISSPGGKFPNQSPIPLPDLSADYQKWRDWAAAGNPPVTCPCNISTSAVAGPQQYNGDLTINNNGILTVTGPIYVTGNLSINGGIIQGDSALGNSGEATVVLVDGVIDIQGNGQVKTTQYGGQLLFIAISTAGISPAINIANNQNAQVNAIFYTLQNYVVISNKGNAASVFARYISMFNNSSVSSIPTTTKFYTSDSSLGFTIKKGSFHLK